MARKKADNPAFRARMQDILFHGCDVYGEHHDFKGVQDFAEFLGVTRQSLGFWLHNDDDKRRSPDMDGLIKISKALNMSIDYLVGRSDTNSLDADIQGVTRYTGLSDKAVNFIKEDIVAESLVEFINGFVEDDYSQKFKDAFIKTMSLASYISRYNVDASHTERVPLSYDDHIYYSLEFNMNDLMHNECDHIGKYITEFAHLYFDHLINLPHGNSTDEIFDDSEVK